MDYFSIFLIALFVGLGLTASYQNRTSLVPRILQPKVLDLIMFNGEPLGMLRFFYLNNTVDRFIVMEADVTLSGKKKLFFYLDRYEHYLRPLISTGKLIPLRITFPPHLYNQSASEAILRKLSWEREYYLRNYGKSYTLSMMGSEPFVLIVTDADELPKRQAVRSLPKKYPSLHIPLHLGMTFFYYSFKWLKPGVWTGAYVVNDIFLRDNKTSLQGGRRGGTFLAKAGWHCSYCMNTSDIVQKIQSTSHTEFDIPSIANENWVQTCREQGLDLFRRKDNPLRIYNGSDSYPRCKRCQHLPGFAVLKIP